MPKIDEVISVADLGDQLGVDFSMPSPSALILSPEQWGLQQEAHEQAAQQARTRLERNDAAIQRTAQESIEHTRLLEKQLQEVQAQNEMLKAEAAGYHAEIEAYKHAAKKARRLNIAAFVMSIVLPIIGIVASALIAKYI